MYRENEFSNVGKVAVYLLIGCAMISALYNIYRGIVPNPFAFIVCIVGLLLFVIAKVSVISKGINFSFGTINMSSTMANLYRFGYWLMVVGVLCTFIG